MTRLAWFLAGVATAAIGVLAWLLAVTLYGHDDRPYISAEHRELLDDELEDFDEVPW